MNLRGFEKTDAKKFLTTGFQKTAFVALFLSALLLAAYSIDKAVAFFVASLFGTLNWIALSFIIFGYTEKKYRMAIGGMALKLFAISCFFLLVLPVSVHNIALVLAGFSLFLILACLEALSILLNYSLNTRQSDSRFKNLNLRQVKN